MMVPVVGDVLRRMLRASVRSVWPPAGGRRYARWTLAGGRRYRSGGSRLPLPRPLGPLPPGRMCVYRPVSDCGSAASRRAAPNARWTPPGATRSAASERAGLTAWWLQPAVPLSLPLRRVAAQMRSCRRPRRPNGSNHPLATAAPHRRRRRARRRRARWRQPPWRPPGEAKKQSRWWLLLIGISSRRSFPAAGLRRCGWRVNGRGFTGCGWLVEPGAGGP